MSDHCLIAVVFKTDGSDGPSDVIADLLNRLDAVVAELQEIKQAISALRE